MESLCVLVLFVFLSIGLVNGGRDFYKILGVERTAKQEDIVKAYRKLAKVHHPDRNKNNPKANEMFQDISGAYEVLKDEEKRRIYDRAGEEGLANSKGGSSSGFASGFGNIFNSFFNFGNREEGENSESAKGGDIDMYLHVHLNELYTGTTIKFEREKMVKKVAAGKRKCNCRMELKTVNVGPGQYHMVQQRVCDECPNFTYERESVRLEVDLIPGMPDGHTLIIHGEGEPHADGEPGDIKLRLKVGRDETFCRIGDDLHTNMTISLLDALIGFHTQITHLDGHKVNVSRSNQISTFGDVMKIVGEGMPRYKSTGSYFGDLYVTFDIQMPKTIEKESVNDLKKILSEQSFQQIKNRC